MTTRNGLAITFVLLAINTATAQPMSSTNYGVAWSVVDGGGAPAMSNNYGLEGSVAQSSPINTTTSAGYAAESGFFAAPDSDADTVRDFMDNCTFDPNATQLDSNGDGYGNLCDPDLDDSGAINFADYALLTSAFLSSPQSPNWNPDADLTGDGLVNFVDIALFQFFFLQPPGPSGLAP